MRSCEPTVERCRLMAESRGRCVEKADAVFVLRTSLSMVLGMAMTLTPSLCSRSA